MLDHRQEVAGNRHISSSTSTYHTHSRRESGGDREFSFWCSSNTISSGNDCDQLEGSSGEGCGVSFPPLWETYKGTSFKFEHSPLLPNSHHRNRVSPTSRSKDIAEGRTELMQMIQDLPESSFELSFQDMVEKQQVLQPVQNETSIDNKIKNSIDEAHVRKQNRKKKKKKKNSNKPNQILRVESMNNENFLLKMFSPTSLDWIKKVKVGNISKLSPTPSFQESIKQVGKEQKIKKSSQAGDNRSDVKDNTGESTNNSRNRNNKSRYVDGNFSLGCWPFSLYSKTKRQGG